MALDPVALIVSLLALGVSVWSVVASRSTGRAQNVLQARLLKLESARERDRLSATKRAQVRADIAREGDNYHLRVCNEGAAPARGIDVQVDGRSVLEHDHVLADEDDVVRTLGSGATARYLLLITMDTPPIFDVAVSWEDDSEQPGTWHSELRWQ